MTHLDAATLFLSGDVMTGRGIDQILPHPSDPKLFEPYVQSALGYVTLAEEAHGAIPKPVSFSYVWGEARAELDRRHPAARLINLETAVTVSDKADPKGINYRMHPANVPVVTAAGIDCCVLANNHVLDWGEKGLTQTLAVLREAGIETVGAGRDLQAAARPAVLPLSDGRILVFAYGSPTSGVPSTWAATPTRPGVKFLTDLDRDGIRAIAGQVEAVKRPRDIVVASIHWGSNWGYDIPWQQRDFAHQLIDDAGIDVVWGHSSHHPRPIEVHHGKLILFGCGDFLNDYEGIQGYEQYRDDLVLMYLPEVSLSDGRLRRLTMVPFQIHKFRLRRPPAEDVRWLINTLNREGKKYGTRVEPGPDDALALRWSFIQ